MAICCCESMLESVVPDDSPPFSFSSRKWVNAVFSGDLGGVQHWKRGRNQKIPYKQTVTGGNAIACDQGTPEREQWASTPQTKCCGDRAPVSLARSARWQPLFGNAKCLSLIVRAGLVNGSTGWHLFAKFNYAYTAAYLFDRCNRAHRIMRIPTREFSFSLLAIALVGLAGCHSAENEYQPPPPPEVTVARPVKQLVTPFLQKNGETEAVQEAEVRARVIGFVEDIKFQPGQEVDKDDLLYVIESEQYEAAVSSAQAAVAYADAAIGVAEAAVKTSEAEVKEAALNLSRETELLNRGAGSKADYDTAVASDEAAKAKAESAAASVKASQAEKGRAEAALEKAQLDLGYTTVRAPIAGLISKTDVKEGNLVENGTELATIVDHDEIFVNFTITDRELLRFLQSEQDILDKGEELRQTDWRELPVYLGRETDDGFPFEGKLEYIDPEGVRASTGTLGLRAKLSNPARQLLPGMFVTVRIPGKSEEEILIPEHAIGRDQRGQYVLTIDSENKVERTGVKVYRSMSGWSIITEGLTLDSLVVVDGIQRARPGLPVTPQEQQLSVDRQLLLRGISATGSDESAPPPTENERTENERSESE